MQPHQGVVQGEADHLWASVALDGLEPAARRSSAVWVRHSDCGVPYASGDYIALLDAAGIQPSMRRAGCPYDVAMGECFMKAFNYEEVDTRVGGDLAHARAAFRGGAARPRRGTEDVSKSGVIKKL